MPQTLTIPVMGAMILFCFSIGFASVAGFAFAHPEGMHEHHSPDVSVDIKTNPSLKAGEPAEILFIMRDSGGEPLRGLTPMHDRLLHVVIASADFSVFAHVHPEDFGPITDEMRNRAEYPVWFTFPKAGRYLIAADSAVEGHPFSRHSIKDVAGSHQTGSFLKDLSREKKFGDFDVTLSTVPDRVPAGKETVLKYMIRKEGEPVRDLEPYLAAMMHVAIMSTDLKEFIHAHGEPPGAGPGHHHVEHAMHMSVPDRFGPEIYVPVVFPKKGLYQIFSEVKRKGRVTLMSFMVEVE